MFCVLLPKLLIRYSSIFIFVVFNSYVISANSVKINKGNAFYNFINRMARMQFKEK
jgi:hypothetical protein